MLPTEGYTLRERHGVRSPLERKEEFASMYLGVVWLKLIYGFAVLVKMFRTNPKYLGSRAFRPPDEGVILMGIISWSL